MGGHTVVCILGVLGTPLAGRLREQDLQGGHV